MTTNVLRYWAKTGDDNNVTDIYRWDGTTLESTAGSGWRTSPLTVAELDGLGGSPDYLPVARELAEELAEALARGDVPVRK